ncbi:MAG: type II toxin-antitoxin system HicB family antitoxin [Geminicoccaceae bacterium]
MARYIALIDGEPGAFGVVFPDCPGCTAMGATLDEALVAAAEALADWAGDVAGPRGPDQAQSQDGNPRMPKPRSVAELRAAPEVRRALADGAALAVVPLILEAGRPVKANLSLDAGLLAAIDEAAAARGLTRSAFLASAARAKIVEQR